MKYYLDLAVLTVCHGVCVLKCVYTYVLREKHQCSMVPFHNILCVKGKEFGEPGSFQLDINLTVVLSSLLSGRVSICFLNVRKG